MPNFEQVAGWEKEIPKYRVVRPVSPPSRARYRDEKPFSTMADSDCWQYADRFYAADEIVSTTAWCHPSFEPLNFSAQQVLAFFKAEMKSRLPQSPWFDGQVRLSNGL